MKIKTKSKKVNKAWLADHINDPYVKMAQKDGYRARAAYKLKEIDETLKLIRPGQVVVDLGASPGAWSQYLRRRFAPKEAGAGGAAVGELNGTIIALDILPFEPVEGVHFIQGDFREEAVTQQLADALAGRPVDVVVSDMAPNLSGIESADSARIAHLVELAVEFDSTPSGRRGVGVQGVPWQRLQPAGGIVQTQLSCHQTDQAESLAGQVVGNVSGGNRAQGGRVASRRGPIAVGNSMSVIGCGYFFASIGAT